MSKFARKDYINNGTLTINNIIELPLYNPIIYTINTLLIEFFKKKLDEIFIKKTHWSIWYEIINKWAGPNKQAGRNFLKKLINEQGQIRACRMEKPQIINM